MSHDLTSTVSLPDERQNRFHKMTRKDRTTSSRICWACCRLETEEKRVENRLIKEELGVRLKFPSYREGLRAIRSQDTRPFNDQ